jgi:hypothetical protein
VSAEDPELEVLRRADAIAVYTLGSGRWRFVGFEVKRSRADLRRELRRLHKSRAHIAICEEWYVVLPAPWTDYLLTLDELPASWGLVEVGTGGARIVKPALVRDVEPPPDRFLRALYRAAAAAGERLDLDDASLAGIPVRTVSRYLTASRGILTCRHVVERVPRPKKGPARVPCHACFEGLPPDDEATVAAIEDADLEQLALYQQALDRRARELALGDPAGSGGSPAL